MEASERKRQSILRVEQGWIMQRLQGPDHKSRAGSSGTRAC